MGAHDVFRILAVILAIATVGIAVLTGRVRNGWLPWLAIPILAFVWYWAIVCLYMGYYMWQSRGVR